MYGRVFCIVFFALFFLNSFLIGQEATSTALVESGIEKTLSKIIKIKDYSIPVENALKGALSDTLLYNTLAGIKGPLQPFSYGQYMVFVHYDKVEDSRVSIAFAHEQYSKLHYFVRLESNPKVLIYILKKDAIEKKIQYRLVVNSIWTHDYQNKNYIVDAHGIKVSVATMNPLPQVFSPSIVYNELKNKMRFYLYVNTDESNIVHSTSLQKINTKNIAYNSIYVVGDFTGWDPLLIPMKQTSENSHVYYADVFLEKGMYYYYFQLGNYDILDPKNRNVSKRKAHSLYVNSFFIENTIDPDTGRKHLVARTKKQ